jgi:hypothetical protein
MVGRSGPYTGGHVFSLLAFNRFAVAATDQPGIPFP